MDFKNPKLRALGDIRFIPGSLKANSLIVGS